MYQNIHPWGPLWAPWAPPGAPKNSGRAPPAAVPPAAVPSRARPEFFWGPQGGAHGAHRGPQGCIF